MRSIRVFDSSLLDPQLDGADAQFEHKWSKETNQYHHLTRVLRVQPGQMVNVFNGYGWQRPGKVLEVDKKSLTICLDAAIWDQPPELVIELIIGISKAERMDYAIQKATELGVSRILPMYTEFSERAFKTERQVKKMLHWQAIINGACEQCGQNYRPQICEPTSIEKLAAPSTDIKRFICHGSDNSRSLAYWSEEKMSHLQFVIGPEGGFSTTDLQILKNLNSDFVRLGPRILRTETAPVVAISLAQAYWGDFQAF